MIAFGAHGDSPVPGLPAEERAATRVTASFVEAVPGLAHATAISTWRHANLPVERGCQKRGGRETATSGDLGKAVAGRFEQLLGGLDMRTAHLLQHRPIEHAAKAPFEPLPAPADGPGDHGDREALMSVRPNPAHGLGDERIV